MQDRPLYVLPFRVVLGILLLIFLMGAAGGAVGAWAVLRRIVRVTPEGERVIERVERVTVTAEDALASAAASVAPSTVSLLDDRDRMIRHALAVTADGILVSSGPVPAGRVRARLPSGDVVPASVVRIYQEAGLFFLRASGSFPVATIDRESVPPPGSAVAIVGNLTDAVGPRVQVMTVEVARVGGTQTHARSPALERIPVLAGELPLSFQGAPAVAVDGRVRGLIVVEDGIAVVPGGVLDVLLQDLLRHPDGTEVQLLRGVQGRWERRAGEADSVYRVATVSEGIFADGGVRRGDVLRKVAGKPFQPPLPLFAPLLDGARSGTRVTVEVLRDAGTLSLELAPSI